MEQFTEDHAKRLLGIEWMAKTDAGTSTPYLFKYHVSIVDLTCVIMVTDTKKVWAEVVNDKILARRWRACNPRSPEPFFNDSKEENWREKILDLLSRAHTIGGIADSSYEVVNSKYSDLCMDLEWEAFKWKWEACFIGYPMSSEIISKQLVSPLISLNHLTFSTAEVFSEMSDGDIEKALDKVARTARRTPDTHIKNAISKPRLATCITRLTAMFNFIDHLPPVTSISEKPLLRVEEETETIVRTVSSHLGKHVASPAISQTVTPPSATVRSSSTIQPADRELLPPKHEHKATPQVTNDDSETEPDSDDPADKSGPSHPVTAGPSRTAQEGPSQVTTRPTAPPSSRAAEGGLSSDSDGPRPIKKAKPSVLPDSSDDDEPKRPGAPGGAKRSTRQPIKRGGKRF